MRILLGLLLGCLFLSAADDRVKVDNEVVRILRVVDLPHNKTPLHRHEGNRVMIYLDAGDLTVISEDGRKDEQHWQANQVAWSPAGGLHTSENVGSAPLRIVEVELKKPASSAPVARNPKLDPVVIDPKHNSLLFENDQVRVFRSWREPGATEPMHEHIGTGRAAVLLADFDAKATLADGTTSMQRGSAGDVYWSGPLTHATTNLGHEKMDMIVVEVK